MIRQYTKTWHNVEQMKALNEWRRERMTTDVEEGVERMKVERIKMLSNWRPLDLRVSRKKCRVKPVIDSNQ